MSQCKITNLITLVLYIIVILTIGYVVVMITSINIPSWFIYLESPYFAPPNWEFAPVWTSLYSRMAISGWLIFQHHQLKQ
ncbi:tryptophan-rich sensory protein, partial [Francisella tularensis subsp. holarctica]|uniref:tryptophan-rich sensory protein n=1 Tax=Francisella tularensis TaxID=263 RepID=UPI002381A5AC